MKKFIGKIRKAATGIFAVVSAVFTRAVFVFADGAADWMGEGSTDGGELAPVVEKTKGLGQSIYTLMRTLGICIMVICGILVGISLMVSKRGQKKDESMSWAFNICIGGLIVGGVITIAGIFLEVGGRFGM